MYRRTKIYAEEYLMYEAFIIIRELIIDLVTNKTNIFFA